MKIFTIGYGKKNAEHFFETIKSAGVKTVMDVRLYNTSQLAGFAKRDDLIYFLNKICGCNYKHVKELAPSPQLLDGYKKGHISWQEYEVEYNAFISSIKFSDFLSMKELESACLLCAEPTPDNCHRRLVAEYVKSNLPEVEIVHL